MTNEDDAFPRQGVASGVATHPQGRPGRSSSAAPKLSLWPVVTNKAESHDELPTYSVLEVSKSVPQQGGTEHEKIMFDFGDDGADASSG